MEVHHAVLVVNRRVHEFASSLPTASGTTWDAALACKTPTRAKALDDLVRTNRIPADTAVSLVQGERIGNNAWKLISAVVAGEEFQDDSLTTALTLRERFTAWSASLISAGGDSDDLWATDAVNEQGLREDHLPLQRIVRVLDDLAAEGWAVLSVSETRSIDDVTATTTVTEVRYLLRREDR